MARTREDSNGNISALQHRPGLYYPNAHKGLLSD